MISPTPIVQAATIMLVRNAPALEILLVQRHSRIDFGGAVVFPGGKIILEDADPAWQDLTDGASGDRGVDVLRIAAIREAFEETGLLLARPFSRRGVGAPLMRPQDAPFFFSRDHRNVAGGNFQTAIREAGLALALDALAPFANWVTPDEPEFMPRRFDTHFFVAIAPEDQVAICDGREAVDLCWIAPAEALSDAAEGRRNIIVPTRLNIELLSRSKDAEAAIADARARPRFVVHPLTEIHDGMRMQRIPVEAGYATTLEPFDLPWRYVTDVEK